MSTDEPLARTESLPYENPFKFAPTLSRPRATGTIKVTVGPDPITQRTWFLPRALIVQHSTHLAQLCANPFWNEITLEDIDVRAFANFVDYMRSSIYTLNEQIPGFRRIHEGTKAYLLGLKLVAMVYSNAALTSLHMLFEPLARLKSSNMRKSMIRAEDINFVCHNTDPNGPGRGLRQLFLDAVASHWSHWEANKLTGHHDGYKGEWTDLYIKYADFRITMLTSCRKPDVKRKELLLDVQAYLDADKPIVKKEAVDGLGTKSTPLRVIGDRRTVNPRSIISSMKRKASSERRRKERAEAGQVATDTAQSSGTNEIGEQEGGEVQAAAENDWMMVDAEIKREERA